MVSFTRLFLNEIRGRDKFMLWWYCERQSLDLIASGRTRFAQRTLKTITLDSEKPFNSLMFFTSNLKIKLHSRSKHWKHILCLFSFNPSTNGWGRTRCSHFTFIDLNIKQNESWINKTNIYFKLSSFNLPKLGVCVVCCAPIITEVTLSGFG